jgi:hypothetical protein
MSTTENNKREELVTLYDDLLRLVEEEIYQRRNGKSFKDLPSSNAQTGGGRGNFQTGGAIPGKFDIIRYSMEVPLDVALRGTLARQRLFTREQSDM